MKVLKSQEKSLGLDGVTILLTNMKMTTMLMMKLMYVSCAGDSKQIHKLTSCQFNHLEKCLLRDPGLVLNPPGSLQLLSQ